MSQFLEIDSASLLKAKEALRTWQEPNMTKVLRKASLAGARVLVKPLRAAAPRGHNVPKDYPRDLAGSIRVAYSKGSSARGGVAYIVGPIGKKAFTRYWVTGGTKPHTIPKQGVVAFLSTPLGVRRVIHHPGSKPNPFIERVGQQYRSLVTAAMVRSIASQANAPRKF